ncbi:MAG: hypothetical protein LBR43_03120 [Spiroplasmataceae bacterium]|nr:hypothetical protein [Spiroplasmataceae bacterium]
MKKSWLDEIAFSKMGIDYTWGYVVFLLIPSLIILIVVIAYYLLKN